MPPTANGRRGNGPVTYLPPGLNYIKSHNKLPYISFCAVSSLERRETRPQAQHAKSNHVASCTCKQCRAVARRLAFQPTRLLYRANIPLVSCTLEEHGFERTSSNENFNVFWAQGAIKAATFYHGLSRYQKVSQFPRTHEITRKDQLCRNIRRMQQLHGQKHFDFIPLSFVLPGELDLFRREAERCPGASWIVKPAASACGRGIFVTDNVEDVPRSGAEGNCLVSRYVLNPLLLDGRKFDVRLYVAVTSFKPLKVYLYEEGLVRLSTEKYTTDPASLANRFVHLTNYSVQKKSSKFVPNQAEGKKGGGWPDAGEDNESSHKWSIAAFRRRLQKMGHNDVAMWEEVRKVLVKAIIAIEPQVNAAMDMYVKHPSNCFQLFGFDILFDQALKPWLIEVNLGPSLSCGSPLDHAIKSSMIADLLTLAGVQPYDPAKLKACAAHGIPLDFSHPSLAPAVVHGGAETKHAEDVPTAAVGARSPRRRKHGKRSSSAHAGARWMSSTPDGGGAEGGEIAAAEERRAIRELEEEELRSGAWTRIFPDDDALAMKPFFPEKRPLNDALARHILSKRGSGLSDSLRGSRSGTRHLHRKPNKGQNNSGGASMRRTSRLKEDTLKHQLRQKEALESRRAQADQLRQLTGWRG